MKRLGVIILNYRQPALTIDCLRTLEGEIAPHADRHAVIIDQDSGDGSADKIEAAMCEHNWMKWLTLVRSPANLGFAGGNNLGFRSVEAQNYLLFNSDARATPGCIDTLLGALERHPDAGAIGPRLQDPDGTPQISCFRYRTPVTEFLDAAGTSVFDRMFAKKLVPMGVFDEPMEPQWESFACIMIRRAVIDQIGPMDDQYFMYFEDMDYARHIRAAGWKILHWPAAKVVHLRGGSSSVKSAMKARQRVPKYYYEARSRYYAKFYGGTLGLWMTNFLWLLGRVIAWTRETLGRKTPDVCEQEAWDNWTNWLMPMKPPSSAEGRRVVMTEGIKASGHQGIKATNERAPSMLSRARMPDFIIIGAMKCATSTLHEQLARQPGIVMSTPKEPNFFSNDEEWARGIEWYRGLFAEAKRDDLCGESSTHYTKLPTYPHTIERMRKHLPRDVKLIYVMRHPIDRLVSQYIHEWTQRAIDCPIDEAIDKHPELIAYSQYAMQLRPFFDAFSRAQILPLFFERFIDQPQEALERVCRFIGYAGTPRWHDEAAEQNVSSQRLRKSGWRDAVMNLPGMAAIRRRLVPKALRERIKGAWMMKERPQLSQGNLGRLHDIFNEDLATLGSWLNHDRMSCDNFKQIATTTLLTWHSPAKVPAA